MCEFATLYFTLNEVSQLITSVCYMTSILVVVAISVTSWPVGIHWPWGSIVEVGLYDG